MPLFLLTILGTVALLVLAIWPGLLEDFLFLAIPLLLIIIWLFLLVSRIVRGQGRGWSLASLAVLLVTLALLGLHVPQRIAFALCHTQLREWIDAPPADAYRGEPLDRQVGPYWVDRWGADRRGGVFFRTHAGPDGIGPDEMSYGFAYQPNGQGTPFGNSHHRLCHLFDDWYAFAASDD